MKATKEGTKAAALSKAYFGAHATRKSNLIAERTASGPRINKVLKSGKLSATSLENGDIHTWTTHEEAIVIASKMEAMNPGSQYRVSM